MNYIKLALLGGAGYLAYKYIPTGLTLVNLKYEFVNFGLESVKEDNITMSVVLKIKNSSSKSVLFQNIKADIKLNGETVGTINDSYAAMMPAHSDQLIRVFFTINKADIKSNIWQMIVENNTNLTLGLSGSVKANDTVFPLSVIFTIKDLISGVGIGAVDTYTPAQKTWIERMGTSTFILTEPFGTLWKARGKKIFVEPKKKDITYRELQGLSEQLKRIQFIDNVQDAGGDNVFMLTLK